MAAPQGEIDGHITITNAATEQTLVAAPTGIDGRNHLEDLIISIEAGTAVRLILKDGASGPTKFHCWVPATGMPVHIQFKRPKRFSAGKAIIAQLSLATSTVTLSAHGFVTGNP